MASRLLILHDSPDFGGHERMLLAWLPAVLDPASGIAAAICIPVVNHRLLEALKPFAPHLRILTWPFVKQRGEPHLHRLRFRYRAAVRRLIAAERPDTVLLVQGRIENLAVPMAALPRSIRVISYVPMAHRLAEMGRRIPMGDAIRRMLYARPDQFIVPSPAIAEQVAKAGGRGAAFVVPNVVSVRPRTEREVARATLGLPMQRRIALFLGRLDQGQKGLDILAKALEHAAPRSLDGWSFVFAGDGPGSTALAALRDRGITDIHLAGWTDRPDMFLSAADVLMLPSRWEGLPLAMLEAMHFGVPVLASSLDVFREALPAVNIVDFNTVELGAALDRVVASGDEFGSHAAAYLEPLTLAASQRRFVEAIGGTRA